MILGVPSTTRPAFLQRLNCDYLVNTARDSMERQIIIIDCILVPAVAGIIECINLGDLVDDS